eukprot:4081779-Prymnesium_polylepis.2
MRIFSGNRSRNSLKVRSLLPSPSADLNLMLPIRSSARACAAEFMGVAFFASERAAPSWSASPIRSHIDEERLSTSDGALVSLTVGDAILLAIGPSSGFCLPSSAFAAGLSISASPSPGSSPPSSKPLK